MSKKLLSFRVEGLSRPISFRESDVVLAALRRIMKGWAPVPSIELKRVAEAPRPILSVERVGEKWACSSERTSDTLAYSDPVSAACWMAARIVREHTFESPERLCLHGASVDINGGLVVMPSRFRAGKSVLSATLASMGMRIFGDDVLPVDPATGEGVAAGVTPRLRLPLPETLSAETHEFIAARKGPEGKRYLYLDLPDALIAGRGTRMPIRGFALLERVDDGPAHLTRVASGDALKQVIWQNFSREGEATTILDSLADIALSAPCLKLRYARPEDGARALIDAFEAPSLDHLPEAAFQLDAEKKATRRKRAPIELAPSDRVVRIEGCELQARAARHFLIGAEGLTIMTLNELGAALWRLIETPTTYGELLEIVMAAFPDENAERIDEDLRASIGEFRRHSVAYIQR